jgi:hypothetical protein
LNNCLSLKELPTFIGQWNAFQDLDLWGCSKLQELPTSIGQFSALQNLDLKNCLRLQELPTYIGQFNTFQTFICQGVWVSKNYLHFLGNWMHVKSLSCWLNVDYDVEYLKQN